MPIQNAGPARRKKNGYCGSGAVVGSEVGQRSRCFTKRVAPMVDCVSRGSDKEAQRGARDKSRKGRRKLLVESLKPNTSGDDSGNKQIKGTISWCTTASAA
jgi:hypothetical protein